MNLLTQVFIVFLFFGDIGLLIEIPNLAEREIKQFERIPLLGYFMGGLMIVFFTFVVWFNMTFMLLLWSG